MRSKIFRLLAGVIGAVIAEFAALGIFLGALIATPFVLILNSFVALQNAGSAKECFWYGMIVPSVVLFGAIVYQTGLWDAIT